MLPMMTTACISVHFQLANVIWRNAKQLTSVTAMGTVRSLVEKERRDVDLRKFPSVGLWYVCVLVALACAMPLFMERPLP